MKTEQIAIMLVEMAVGIIAGFVIWSYLAPTLAAATASTNGTTA